MSARYVSKGFVVASFLLASILSACSAAPMPDGDVARTSQAVTNGTPVGPDFLGSVMLWDCPAGAASCCPGGASTCSTSLAAFKGGCSGTMVADRWMLTAGHCVNTTESTAGGGTPLPTSEIVAITGDRATVATADEIFMHPTLDVALVHLNASMKNASGTIFTTPLYTGTSASLLNKGLYCQGYGVSDGTIATYGTLRSAYLTVNGAGPGWIALAESDTGQLLSGGDSGTACFLDWPTSSVGAPPPNAVVGVQSLEFPSEDNIVGADGFATWAASIVAANACSTQGAACGTITDAFGQSVSCGSCTGGFCYDNQCYCLPLFTCPANACGAVPNGCGGTLACAACPAGDRCVSNACVSCTRRTCPIGFTWNALDCECISTGCPCGGIYPECRLCQ